MNQQIRYRGLSLAKDEQAVTNGELALCANCELYDGALRPSVITGTKISDNLTDSNDAKNGCNLIYVHVTTAYTHLIAFCPDTGYLVWFQKDGTRGAIINTHQFDKGITDINSIGNTLIVIAPDGVHYILYRNTDGANGNYKYLGQKPPFLSIQFSLSDNYAADYETGGVTVSGSTSGFICAFQQTTTSCNDALESVSKTTAFQNGDVQLHVKTEKQSDITQNVWALVNRTNNLIAKQGHFYANFFVRYCYRLYDGSMVMHSAPVFIPVLVPNNYLVYVVNAHQADDHTLQLNDNLNVKRTDAAGKELAFPVSSLTFMYFPRNVALKYSWRNDNDTILKLKDWSDIVKSVDFFITPPVTRTDESRTIKDCVYQPDNFGLNAKDGEGVYGVWQYMWYLNGDTSKPGKTVVDFPGLSDKGYADKIANQSAFFKVCTFNIDDIQPTGSEPQDLPIDQSVLLTVSAQEQMKDDYKSHNMLYPKGCYVYNHRLNLFGLYETLFPGFNDVEMQPYGVFPIPHVGSDTIPSDPAIGKIVVRLNTDNGYKYVEVPGASQSTLFQLYNCPLFYPDARADRMYVKFSIDTKKIGSATSTTKDYWAQFTLTPCNELNGSMHVGNMKVVDDDIANYTTVSEPTYTLDNKVSMYNRIYTSEQNNPFYFPVEAINSVGTGDVIGLAATTRALSQGQFGQFPLMAFTTDGIWALNVASTGTYSSIHPISRELCVNADSICQLDQSVVFATDRALNKVVESSVASFSDILDGPFFSIASSLKKIADYFGTDGKEPDTAILALINFNTPPIEYFKAGIVLNDFVNNRIIVLPKDSQDDKVVALVYSVRDDAWSTMLIDHPKAVINSYPYPYLQLKSGRVISLDKKYDYTDVSVHNALIVTRTLSFDNTMLAITGLDQQTDAKNKQTVFIFGSNDNRQWHYVGSTSRNVANYLPGHSYRWFRLAIALQLTQGEKYFQTNLNVTQKYEKI